MPERLLASISPQALIWARDVAGMPLDVAAAKIGVSESRLQQFESGAALPTIVQLRAIGRVYRRPTAFFYLKVLPPKPERIQDFRLLPGDHEEDLPDLLDAVEAARERRYAALELAALLGQDVPQFDVTAGLDDSSDRIAGRIRQRLGVSLATQKTWREPYRVLASWIGTAEQAGILVTQYSRVELAAARGFSLTAAPYPVVALNGKDYPRGKVFTLFHELAHIALGTSGLCDLHDAGAMADVLEPFCNRVAAEALVPAANFLAEPLVTQHAETEWEDWRLRELAATYGVSNEVVLRRLLTLSRTTEEFYRFKRDEYLKAYDAAAEEQSGFLQHFRRVLRDNGALFTSLVLSAYRADLVTPTEVSRLLGGIKLQHLSTIENALEAKAS